MGDTGHDRVDVLVDQIDQRRPQIKHQLLGGQDPLAQQQAAHHRIEIVARTGDLQVATGIRAGHLDEPPFDLKEEILDLFVVLDRPRARFGHDTNRHQQPAV